MSLMCPDVRLCDDGVYSDGVTVEPLLQYSFFVLSYSTYVALVSRTLAVKVVIWFILDTKATYVL